MWTGLLTINILNSKQEDNKFCHSVFRQNNGETNGLLCFNKSDFSNSI